MIENERLKLENQDLTNRKSRFDKIRNDNDSEIEKLRLEVKRLSEENNRIRLTQKQEQEFKDAKSNELEKQNKELKEQ